MSSRPLPGDLFDRVRAVAVAVMIAAGAAMAMGSFLDWVSLSDVPERVENADFGAEEDFDDERQRTEPVAGTETRYGNTSVIAGIVLVAAALMLLIRRRGKWAWLGFIASIVTGGLVISAYRAIADNSSPLYRTLDLVGTARPAFGLTLVAAGAIIGLLASIAGYIATPHNLETREEAPSSRP